MKLYRLAIWGVMIVALTAGVVSYRYFRAPALLAAKRVEVDTRFAFSDQHGVLRHSDEWQGKIRIVNFWASWCAPCRQEIPEFLALQKEFAHSNLQFIGIAIEEAADATRFARQMNIDYPILIGEAGGIALAYQWGNTMNILPFSVVIDSAGTLVYSHPGIFSRAQILQVIQPLLAAPDNGDSARHSDNRRIQYDAV